MKNVTYSDVLSMPTYERRFFLGLLTKDAKQREEEREEQKEQVQIKGSKGTRQTRVSGKALKTRMNSGDIPTK